MNHIKQEFRLADMETEKKLVRNKNFGGQFLEKKSIVGREFFFVESPIPTKSVKKSVGEFSEEFWAVGFWSTKILNAYY